jgi:hypothetical protein
MTMPIRFPSQFTSGSDAFSAAGRLAATLQTVGGDTGTSHGGAVRNRQFIDRPFSPRNNLRHDHESRFKIALPFAAVIKLLRLAFDLQPLLDGKAPLPEACEKSPLAQ